MADVKLIPWGHEGRSQAILYVTDPKRLEAYANLIAKYDSVYAEELRVLLREWTVKEDKKDSSNG